MKKLLSTKDLAELMGVSRVAVFNKIKNGKIKATKVGREYVIKLKDVEHLIGGEPTNAMKMEIAEGVKRVIAQYEETLKLLAKE